MKFFEKVAAQMARHNIFLYMLIGAVTTLALIHFKAINSEEDVRRLIMTISLPLVFFYLLNWKSCVFFYGEEKYRSIMPGRGKNIGIPNQDPHFYQNIVSDISPSRKIAGYLYVISKFITCFFLGILITIMIINSNLNFKKGLIK